MHDSQLRKKLIRLAYENPELRDEILPLVASTKRAADPLAEVESQAKLARRSSDPGDQAMYLAHAMFGISAFLRTIDTVKAQWAAGQVHKLATHVQRVPDSL